ncbi:hypothetical protein DL239_20135 [Sedimentitalea sp. CY04]|uniref:Uncharacterized protein n=1 Tax=Parasedimentitalea denitrificans TaxID=2211118 RepID=A0ABX0WC50_9RHOB|nr:hypothetical protein [Sedimentitalea sp. CY04]NIZ63280.1 hypothetical protein [Sedimentitalea sp. CY04]
MVALSPKTIMTGNPPSAAYEPKKSDIADWMQEIESIAVGGGLAYIDGSLVDLQARSGAVDGQFSLVLTTAEEAGVYERVAGIWVKNAAVPSLFLESTVADQAVASAAAAALSEGAAETARGLAEGYKTQAELAALVAGAAIFATDTDGLAATSEGEVFIVHSGSTTSVYKNVSAAAVYLGAMFDKADLLQSANNLSDVPNKAAALATLGGLGASALDPLTKRLDNDAGVVLLGGTGGAYTLVAQSPIAGYAALQSFTFRVNETNAAAVTLNVDGRGARAVQKYNSSGSRVALAAGDWRLGQIHRVIDDGTRYILVSPVMNPATQAQAEAGVNGETFMTPETTAQAIAAQSDNFGPEEVGSPYHGIYPYDGVTVGDGATGLLYDHAVDGNVTVVTTPTLEAGYVYYVYFRGVSFGGSADAQRAQVRGYNASNGLVLTLSNSGNNATHANVYDYDFRIDLLKYPTITYAQLIWALGDYFDAGRLYLYRQFEPNAGAV